MIQVQLCALEELIWSRPLGTDRPELFGGQDTMVRVQQLPVPSWAQVWHCHSLPAAPPQVSASQGTKPAALGQPGDGGTGTAKAFSPLLKIDVGCEGMAT